MKIRCKQFSDTSLLAIYLLLLATQKGANRIVISNDALKCYFGRERVHASLISEFANSLKPIFPRNRIATEYYGVKNCLILYLSEIENKHIPRKIENVASIPAQDEIDRALPLYKTEIEGEKLKYKRVVA